MKWICYVIAASLIVPVFALLPMSVSATDPDHYGLTGNLTDSMTAFYHYDGDHATHPEYAQLRGGAYAALWNPWPMPDELAYFDIGGYQDWDTNTSTYDPAYEMPLEYRTWPLQEFALDDDIDNKTINSVYLVAFVNCTVLQWFNLSLSFDDKATWPISHSFLTTAGAWTNKTYNITSEHTPWEWSDVIGLDTWVRVSYYDSYLVPIYVDYAGLAYNWTDDTTYGGYTPPADDDDGGGFTPGGLIKPGGMMGILGILGFAGMIAMPAYFVWSSKHSEESKLILFVKVLVLFLFFFTLFLAAIS